MLKLEWDYRNTLFIVSAENNVIKFIYLDIVIRSTYLDN